VTNAAVRLGLGPSLKQLGFTKGRTHYYRHTDSAIQVVNIQSSQHNVPSLTGFARFRINLGVHFPSVAVLLHGSDAMPEKPKEMYCLLRGVLSTGQGGRWWQVGAESTTESLAAELNQFWREFAWPWLERNSSLVEAARELELQGNFWAAAAAYLHMGEREHVASVLQRGVKMWKSGPDSGHPANAKLLAERLRTLREWAERHNIAITT
jgi:hypothetical protein